MLDNAANAMQKVMMDSGWDVLLYVTYPLEINTCFLLGNKIYMFSVSKKFILELFETKRESIFYD